LEESQREVEIHRRPGWGGLRHGERSDGVYPERLDTSVLEILMPRTDKAGSLMSDRNPDGVWNRKGATFSDKSARKEFGLTQDEIIKAINRGDLQYRVNAIHGNPFLRLIRSEVEAFVAKKYGGTHLQRRQIQAELGRIDRDLKRLTKEVVQLRERKAELLAGLEDLACQPNKRADKPRRAQRK
jgi:hypothetical protein